MPDPLKTVVSLRLILISLFVFFVTANIGCSGSAALKPSELDDSLIGTVVTVKGKIEFAVEDPMGVGGLYMTLGDDDEKVDVRIQEELWESYSEERQDGYYQGETVTVEGLLVRAGEVLVIVHGKYGYDTPAETDNSSTEKNIRE